MALVDGERSADVIDIYAALLKEDVVMLETQNKLVMTTTEATLDANKRVGHDKLLALLPNTGMTKHKLGYAIKATRKRIRQSRAVKERLLQKQKSSLQQASSEYPAPLVKASMESDATEPRTEGRVERRDPSYGVCESKNEDNTYTGAVGALSLLVVAAARHQPHFQGEAGVYDSSAEQAPRATNDKVNVTDQVTSNVAIRTAR